MLFRTLCFASERNPIFIDHWWLSWAPGNQGRWFQVTFYQMDLHGGLTGDFCLNTLGVLRFVKYIGRWQMLTTEYKAPSCTYGRCLKTWVELCDRWILVTYHHEVLETCCQLPTSRRGSLWALRKPKGPKMPIASFVFVANSAGA